MIEEIKIRVSDRGRGLREKIESYLTFPGRLNQEGNSTRSERENDEREETGRKTRTFRTAGFIEKPSVEEKQNR